MITPPVIYGGWIQFQFNRSSGFQVVPDWGSHIHCDIASGCNHIRYNIQALHRARQRIVNHRTATACQIRGLLLDRGITIGAAVSRSRCLQRYRPPGRHL